MEIKLPVRCTWNYWGEKKEEDGHTHYNLMVHSFFDFLEAMECNDLSASA